MFSRCVDRQIAADVNGKSALGNLGQPLFSDDTVIKRDGENSKPPFNPKQ